MQLQTKNTSRCRPQILQPFVKWKPSDMLNAGLATILSACLPVPCLSCTLVLLPTYLALCLQIVKSLEEVQAQFKEFEHKDTKVLNAAWMTCWGLSMPLLTKLSMGLSRSPGMLDLQWLSGACCVVESDTVILMCLLQVRMDQKHVKTKLKKVITKTSGDNETLQVIQVSQGVLCPGKQHGTAVALAQVTRDYAAYI